MLCLLHVNKEYPQFGGQKYNSIIKETVKKYARLKILYTSNLLLHKKNKLYVEKTWYICINLNKSKRKKKQEVYTVPAFIHMISKSNAPTLPGK